MSINSEMVSSISIRQTAKNDFPASVSVDYAEVDKDFSSSITARVSEEDNVSGVLTTRHKKVNDDLQAKLNIKNEYKKPKRPSLVVTETVLTFLRAIFHENYENGNWHMDPLEEMYIRDQYPEDIKESGIKPGIVTGKQGGMRYGLNSLGELNFLPMQRDRINTMHGDDEVLSGNMNLKTISPISVESEELAYLTMISINKFVSHLIGVNGIAHIHCMGYQDTVPEDMSSEIKLWSTQVMLEFVINVPFATTNLGDRLEDITLKGG